MTGVQTGVQSRRWMRPRGGRQRRNENWFRYLDIFQLRTGDLSAQKSTNFSPRVHVSQAISQQSKPRCSSCQPERSLQKLLLRVAEKREQKSRSCTARIKVFPGEKYKIAMYTGSGIPGNFILSSHTAAFDSHE